MDDELKFQQDRIRDLAQSLADALEYLTEHARRAKAAHGSMEHGARLLNDAANSFSEDTTKASTLVREVIFSTPHHISEAVKELASEVSKNAVDQATADLKKSTKAAIDAANELKKWARAERLNLFLVAGSGSVLGGLVGMFVGFVAFRFAC